MLSLLGAGLAPGCLLQRRAPVVAVPTGPLYLAWRWVPGLSMTYRTLTRRTSAGISTRRAEQWTYLVTSLSGSSATLVGHLTGLGAGVTAQDEPLDVSAAIAEERARLADPVTVVLGADGRLEHCSATDFSDSLVHRLLALRLPQTAVERNAEWSAPDLARPFSALMPLEVDLQISGGSRLSEVNRRERLVLAIIETRGRIAAAGGLTVHLSSTSAWDLQRGALDSRQLTARFTPSGPTPSENPGRLDVQVSRIA